MASAPAGSASQRSPGGRRSSVPSPSSSCSACWRWSRDHARSVDWPAVWKAIRGYPLRTLLTAGALAAASYALYCCFDLIGRHETGHKLARREVAAVGFVCYALNLNLGTLVGGVALRLRLYGRLGLAADVVAKIIALSWLTNWLGYVFLGGLVFVFMPIALPPDWASAAAGLRWLGAALLLATVAYVGLCFGARQRQWKLRGYALRLPSGRIALLQVALSMANWALIGAVVWVLLQHQVDYPTALSVLLIAAVAGVLAHVPGGLGRARGGVRRAALAPRRASRSDRGSARLPRDLLPGAPRAGDPAVPVPRRARRPAPTPARAKGAAQLARRRRMKASAPSPAANSAQVSGSGIVAIRKSWLSPLERTSIR